MSKCNVIISGWYGQGNVGDEAILTAIIDEVNILYDYPSITVLSTNPAYTRKHHNVNSVFQIPSTLKGYIHRIITFQWLFILFALLKVDVFILGGGGFLSDRIKDTPKNWLKQLRIAKHFNAKTYLYKVGIGPLLTENGKKQVQYYLTKFADEVIVRDHFSSRILIDNCLIDAGKVKINIDPVAKMKLENLKNITSYVNHNMVVYGDYFVKPYNKEMRKKLIDLYFVQIDTFLSLHEKVLITFFQPNDEIEFSKLFQERYSSSNLVDFLFCNDYRDALNAISSVKSITSFRFHGNVLAYNLNKPFLPIVYHHKTQGFLDLIEYKANDIVLHIGDGFMNWKQNNMEDNIWIQRTKRFIEMVNQDCQFYNK